MPDIKKQTDYWIKGAYDDLATAELLIEKKRVLHGLFFCYLAIEKAIKAHVVNRSKEVAPKTHNLIYLSDKANLQFDKETEIFLGILMKYQLQGRYPDYNPDLPDLFKVNEYLNKAKTLLKWLEQKL